MMDSDLRARKFSPDIGPRIDRRVRLEIDHHEGPLDVVVASLILVACAALIYAATLLA